jgi:hypothetical protein
MPPFGTGFRQISGTGLAASHAIYSAPPTWPWCSQSSLQSDVPCVSTRTDTQLAVAISYLRVAGGVAEMEAKMTWSALLNWRYLSHRGPPSSVFSVRQFDTGVRHVHRLKIGCTV